MSIKMERNKIVLSSAIQEQQKLNNSNSSLEENTLGISETYCNYATKNIIKTVSSIFNDESIQLSGLANDILDFLSSSKNKFFVPADKNSAKSKAKKGGLVLVGYRPTSGIGHIATYSVGENTQKGEIANIGPKKYSGFVSLNMAISKKKSKVYYIFTPNILDEVTVKSK